jgi:hypothetical protein
MNTRSPAQLYALVVGAILVVVGVVGFFANTSFAVGADVPRAPLFGFLDVNGWHNVVHLVTGAAGLAAFRNPVSARTYALVLGVVYLIVALWGFALGGGVILNLLPVNAADNLLHLVLGILGLAAWALVRRATAAMPRWARRA